MFQISICGVDDVMSINIYNINNDADDLVVVVVNDDDNDDKNNDYNTKCWWLDKSIQVSQ